MALTISGGAYLSPDGKTWHDANGNPIKKDAVAEFEKVQAQNLERHDAQEQQMLESQPVTVRLRPDFSQALTQPATGASAAETTADARAASGSK